MKPWINNLVTGVLVSCAVLVTVVVVRQEFSGTDPRSTPGRLEDWRSLLDGRAAVIGNAAAERKIVVFSDYECPFCLDLERKLVEIDAAHPGRFAVLRYENPLLQVHANAMKAAIASKCASDSSRYPAFHGALAERGADLASVDYRNLAKAATLPDIERFTDCLETPAARMAVEADRAIAKVLGFEATPTLVVEGVVFSGTQERKKLEALLLK